MKELWKSLNKFYLTNAAVAVSLMLSIVMMFLVQFKVEGLQNQIKKTESEIVDYKDAIQLLEVEWVYLTRPERLRILSAHYLENNNYALANQIKNEEQLERYHLVNYQKIEEMEISSNRL